MRYGIVLIFFMISSPMDAQVSGYLLDELGGWNDTESVAEKTFRTTKIVNMQSVENPHPGELIFTIGHRFGDIGSGFYEMFGLDRATIRLGLDYGINSWLGAGAGRSTFEKTWDTYLKARILNQNGKMNSSFTLAYYFSASQATLRQVYPPDRDNFTGRLSLIQSIMASRKFSEFFSLQLNPIWLHSNYLRETQQPADYFYLGLATRFRLTPMTHINLEYIYEITDKGPDKRNPLSIGFDIETGGHVFQLFFSNTQGIHDKAYLVNTTGTWGNGDIYFGFTITRVFYL